MHVYTTGIIRGNNGRFCTHNNYYVKVLSFPKLTGHAATKLERERELDAGTAIYVHVHVGGPQLFWHSWPPVHTNTVLLGYTMWQLLFRINRATHDNRHRRCFSKILLSINRLWARFMGSIDL